MSYPQNIKSFSPLTSFDLKRIKQLFNGFTTCLCKIFGALKLNKIKAFTKFVRRMAILLRVFWRQKAFLLPICVAFRCRI